VQRLHVSLHLRDVGLNVGGHGPSVRERGRRGKRGRERDRGDREELLRELHLFPSGD